jgi:hypothetical protein
MPETPKKPEPGWMPEIPTSRGRQKRDRATEPMAPRKIRNPPTRGKNPHEAERWARTGCRNRPHLGRRGRTGIGTTRPAPFQRCLSKVPQTTDPPGRAKQIPGIRRAPAHRRASLSSAAASPGPLPVRRDATYLKENPGTCPGDGRSITRPGTRRSPTGKGDENPAGLPFSSSGSRSELLLQGPDQ